MEPERRVLCKALRPCWPTSATSRHVNAMMVELPPLFCCIPTCPGVQDTLDDDDNFSAEVLSYLDDMDHVDDDLTASKPLASVSISLPQHQATLQATARAPDQSRRTRTDATSPSSASTNYSSIPPTNSISMAMSSRPTLPLAAAARHPGNSSAPMLRAPDKSQPSPTAAASATLRPQNPIHGATNLVSTPAKVTPASTKQGPYIAGAPRPAQPSPAPYNTVVPVPAQPIPVTPRPVAASPSLPCSAPTAPPVAKYSPQEIEQKKLKALIERKRLEALRRRQTRHPP